MSVRSIRVGIAAFALSLSALPALAETTDVKIQVRAADAKFIGSAVGGMNVVVEDVQTGALLASGKVAGTTGDTAALMKQGQTRGQAPTTPEAASFIAAIDIDRPVLARFRITGPLDVPQSIQELSATQWVLPGRDQVDPGVVLQLPGLIVAPVEVAIADGELQAEVDVSMMCGCPITEGGLWDSEDFSVNAFLYREGEKLQTFALEFTGQANRFAGKVTAPEPGSYELWISGYESNGDNTGAWHQILEHGGP